MREIGKEGATQAKVYKRVVDAEGKANAIGRRKESEARVTIKEGSGKMKVNGLEIDRFSTEARRSHAIEPLLVIQQLGKFDVEAQVEGGGESGLFLFLIF